MFAAYGILVEIFFFNNAIWSFGEEYMVGWWLWGMPFEEYLFYVVMIPFFMLLPDIIQTMFKDTNND